MRYLKLTIHLLEYGHREGKHEYVGTDTNVLEMAATLAGILSGSIRPRQLILPRRSPIAAYQEAIRLDVPDTYLHKCVDASDILRFEVAPETDADERVRRRLEWIGPRADR